MYSWRGVKADLSHVLFKEGLFPLLKVLHLTLVSAVVEDVQSFYGFFSSLFVTKDQVDPLMEVIGNVVRLLIKKKQKELFLL